MTWYLPRNIHYLYINICAIFSFHFLSKKKHSFRVCRNHLAKMRFQFPHHFYVVLLQCCQLLSKIGTVWKFYDFCIIQILREINFEDSQSAKSAILTHLEALNFNFYEFLHFLKAAIYYINKIQTS